MLLSDIAALFCRECVQRLPAWDFYFWLAITVGATLCSLYRCHRLFKRARLIEDMPTSRIRSASQGYTELVGVAKQNGHPRLAPLSNTLCLWWRYTIEKYQSSGKSSHWVTVEKLACSQSFYLEDNTGICEINPDGADISCHHRHTWYGNTRRPITSISHTKPTNSNGFLSAATRKISFGQRYRYTEHFIVDGDPLYTLGHFQTDATGQRSMSPEQLSGDILRTWKQDFHDLLSRFDKNGDGELDLNEWQQVRYAALYEAKKQQAGLANEPAEHLLSKPQHKGLPFIIGSQEQQQLSRKFRYHSFFYAAGFLLSGAFSSWLINSRFF